MAVMVTRDAVRIFSALVQTIFLDALTKQTGVYQSLATVVPSTLPSEDYAWLSQVPVMREFVDERKINSLGEYGFTLRNRKWESTIGFQREVLEDDQTGSVRVRVNQLVEQAYAHYDKLVMDLVATGTAGVAYDGAAFYSAAHLVNGANISNVGTGVLNAANLQAAISQMMRVPLDNGEPAMVKPTHLLVPPELLWTAQTLIHSAMSPDITAGAVNAANPLYNALIPISSPRLPTTTEWHLFDCSRSVRPFVLQQRVLPELKALDGTDGQSESDFMRDELLYGVRARHNAGYGLWQFAYRSAGTG